MRLRVVCLIVFIALVLTSFPWLTRVAAQASAPLEFDVVSIKHVEELRPGGGMRTLPDGTFMMMNQPLWTVIGLASPVPARDIVGMPDWMMRERYDVTVKPPAGLTREELKTMMPLMWRAMFTERMKLAAHVEQHEKNAYALVLAHSDGRLGPELKPSTLDCTPRPNSPPAPALQSIPSLQERQNRCGMSMSAGLIVSGGTTIDQLARSLNGLAGGDVENRTGLTGSYAVTLKFSLRALGPASGQNAAIDDVPDIFTAVQEQLGLKLQREKKMTPVFVIDRVERPSEN
jgi:uncharacterized protein (TIGR03435 family)